MDKYTKHSYCIFKPVNAVSYTHLPLSLWESGDTLMPGLTQV